jgi:tetratricopeptide (TPR) repeat protein
VRDPSPRAPFDQGLFLTHFNKGQSFYEERRYEDAERELEEAYLLRPRDQRVLNLLGLVYFKQEKLEKAEEVYRKLAAESPDAPTLFHNLGLIHFKLNRLEEAEAAFSKALELSGNNPKINFYLGNIYERLQRFQDAIYQYRQAGANLMVRRVEDKMAAAAPALHPTSAVQKRKDDTAEFLTKDIRQALKQHEETAAKEASHEDTLVPARTLQPVSDVLMAPNLESDTARFRMPPRPRQPALPPPLVRPRFPEVIGYGSGDRRSAAPAPDYASAPRPRRATDVFRFLENNLMEINVTQKVFIKQGTIYSYGGNLTFWVKDRRPGGHPALVMITGQGKTILTDRDRQITFMRVEDETLYVEPNHLLACEETLTPRYAPLDEAHPGAEFLALEGSGMVALSVASKPLPLEVTPDLPVSVPAASIICWSGSLLPHVVDDRHLFEVMMPAPGRTGTLIRLEGTGRLLMEQAQA